MKSRFSLAAAALVASTSVASAATISGTLAGLEGVAPSALEPIDLLGSPYDFQAGFQDADGAGVFQFDFENTGDVAADVQIDFTFLQDVDEAFTGGVQVSFGDESFIVGEGVNFATALATQISAGNFASLIIGFGDPTGTVGAFGPVGPDIDFVANAAPIPLPAGGALLLGALGVMGWRARKAAAAA